MELTGGPAPHGFMRRIRSFISESSTGWESSDKLLDFKTTSSAALAAVIPNFFDAVRSGDRECVQHALRDHPELVGSRDVSQHDALHLAVINGDIEMIQLLAGHLSNLNSKDADGNTPLHLTAAENNIPVAECLLRIGADPRVANEAGDDVLHLAVRSGSVEMVQVLLESQLVDKNSPGWNGETALHVAASQNELECAKLLLQHRADITRRCGSGGLPIHYAARFGSLDVLRFFLQTPKLRVDEMLRSVDDEEATPLHLAVNRGDCDTAELLLEAGAPINAQMFEQSTPLHIACALGASDIVGMIHDFNVLEFGRVLRIGDAQGMTPVHRAAMFNHWHLLRFLIDKHASLDTRDSAGRSVLVLAASRGSWDAVSELLTSGADPLICSNDGQNFLHYVVALGGDPESFKDEIRPTSRFAAILNGKDNAGLTPLHYAAQCGFGTCCDSLVKLGALITAKSRELKTPVHLAAEFGRYSTMKKLLASADRVPAFHGVVNDADSRGQTPLHLAAAHGHLKIVMLLLSKGALMARNLDGALPLHSACATDKKEIVESLITGHAHLVNAVDKRGNTALHIAAESNAHLSAVTLLNSGARLLTNGENLTALDLAIMNGNQEVTEAMVQTDRWKELLLQPSSLYTWPSHG
ncbi:Transient receptor potential cation channel subfamily A member 1 [Hypsibius exemplaris]|uniref:Transient receptor potential cation channel subfamily A member 1 n=1 Tax=Hypsibius exemplaris TaxID=2072580 RepID=A0A1W0WYJ6_HYPEX|nr:Transient receptor potential cation channel subfamily A member 1 [Hypsibius exemplaris]